MMRSISSFKVGTSLIKHVGSMDDFKKARGFRYHFSPKGRISNSNVQALRGC